MTTIHPVPSEQTEVGNTKKNIAVVHPLLKQTDHHSDNTDNIHNGVAESTYKTVSFKDLPLVALLSNNDPLMVKISQMLNRRNNRVIRNWQHLAQAIGVPADISLSFDCDTEQSPTEDLFNHLITWKPDMTFKQLKEILRSAGRNDLILMLEKENYKDLWKVSDNKDFIDQFKDKLDTPKRHMDWRALAIKCKIPRKTFEKFGKPKLGPTEHLFIHVRISKHFESLNVKELKEYLGKMNRFDVLKAIERHKIPDNTLVKDEFKSQTPIMEEVSDLLDKDGPMKNWKNLSYLMGIPGTTYEDFDTSKGTNRNPTELLFQWIFANKPDFTLEKMVKGLQSIERNDVVFELNNGIKQALKEGRLQITHSEENMDLVISQNPNNLKSSDEDSKLLQNLDHLTRKERNALRVTDLPKPFYTKICNLLDVKEPFYRDYRCFAEELGIDKPKINAYEQKESPTHSILLEYKVTIESFVKVIKSFERGDVAEEVEAWLNQSPSS